MGERRGEERRGEKAYKQHERSRGARRGATYCINLKGITFDTTGAVEKHKGEDREEDRTSADCLSIGQRLPTLFASRPQNDPQNFPRPQLDPEWMSEEMRVSFTRLLCSTTMRTPSITDPALLIYMLVAIFRE